MTQVPIDSFSCNLTTTGHRLIGCNEADSRSLIDRVVRAESDRFDESEGGNPAGTAHAAGRRPQGNAERLGSAPARRTAVGSDVVVVAVCRATVVRPRRVLH